MLQNGSRTVIHKNVSTHNASSSGGRVVFVKSVLEVCGVQRGDHGEYSCTVVATGAGGSTGHEERDTATFKLHVLTAPGKHFLVCIDSCMY